MGFANVQLQGVPEPSTVWLLGSGVPMIGILVTGVFALSLQNLTETQFAVAVMIIAVLALVFGFILMWLLSWLTATPVRVVRAALKRVEQGDLDCNVVVFDGTELGELQRGFNSMVDGLKQRERVRDLFGRHVGREVAAALHTLQLLTVEKQATASQSIDAINREVAMPVDEILTAATAVLDRYIGHEPEMAEKLRQVIGVSVESMVVVRLS